MRARGVELSLNPAPFYWRICFGTMLMDLAQAFIFDVGWFFFAAWGMVLAAVSVIAFGRDMYGIRRRENRKNN